ncbi:MAG: GldG family protein [Acidobacteria bacterium]|nr:GldG family protein [Acidobacteriota bacterium]
MKRLLYVATPIGLALLVLAAGWFALAPRVAPVVYQVFGVLGAVLLATGIWARRQVLPRGGGASTVRFGAGALASVGVAVSILLLVNFLSSRYHERIDLTTTKTFSLHPVTIRVLEQLDTDVKVLAFVPSRDTMQQRVVTRLLDVFAYHQPRLDTEVVDPTLRPDLVDLVGIRNTNLTIVRGNDRQVVFPGFEEADLAAALVEVNRKQPKIIYWVMGHGERGFEAGGGLGFNRLRGDLTNEYYEVRPLSVGAGERVPEDASLLIFADPREPIPSEIARIYNAWLRDGGRALLLVDVNFGQIDADAHPAQFLLDRWGVRAPMGVVMDPRARTGATDPRTSVGDVFGSHEAVAALPGMRVVFNVARPLEFFETTEDRQIFHHALVRVGGEPTGFGARPVHRDRPGACPHRSVDQRRGAGAVGGACPHRGAARVSQVRAAAGCRGRGPRKRASSSSAMRIS